MILVTRKFTGKKAYQIPLADTQIGEKEFAEEKLRGYVDWIRGRKNVSVPFVGDMFEVPKKNSKATDVWADRLSPKKSMDLAYEIFAPIADKIDGGVVGNHENRMYQEFGRHPMEELFTRLGLPESTLAPYGEGLLLAVNLNGINYVSHMLHGWGGARTTGGQVNKTEQLGDVVRDADCYITGHEHTLHVTRWDSYMASTGEYRKQYFINAGCFSYYTPFQESIARRMPNVGAVRIRFNGDKRDIHVSI